MKKTMWITALAASGLAAGLVFGAGASAATMSCSLDDATANGAPAEKCAFASPDGSQADRDQLVTDSFDGDWTNTYIGKWDSDKGAEDQENTGYSLEVSGFGDGQFSYTLSLIDPVPDTTTTIEWVLGVKQANSYAVYFWESVTLDIGGTFVSTFTPGMGDTNDYSHIAGYVRSEETTEVPEPAALALLGGGLLALGWAMRRRSRSDFAG